MAKIARYQLCDRDKNEFLTDVGQSEEILERLFTKEEIENIKKDNPDILSQPIEKTIEFVSEIKNVFFIPINEIDILEGESNGISDVQISLNTPTKVNVISISPIELNNELITHIVFLDKNFAYHRYFYRTGKETTNFNDLIAKEEFISKDKSCIKYNFREEIVNVTIDGFEYTIKRSMESLDIYNNDTLLFQIHEYLDEEHVYQRIRKYYLMNTKQSSDEINLINIPLICLNSLKDIENVDLNKVLDNYIKNRNTLCNLNRSYLYDTFAGSQMHKDIICDINSIHFDIKQSDEDNMITIKAENINNISYDITKLSAYFKVKKYKDIDIIDAIFII